MFNQFETRILRGLATLDQAKTSIKNAQDTLERAQEVLEAERYRLKARIDELRGNK